MIPMAAADGTPAGSRRGPCPYCGRDDVELTEEHVIPSVLGGTLTVWVCGPCNTGSNRYVDQPIIRFPDVAILRALHDVRSQRFRSKPPKVQISGRLSLEGGRALYRPGERIDLIQVQPGDPVPNGDGTFSFVVSADAAEQQTASMLRALRQQYPGKTVELVDQELRRSEVIFEHSYPLAPWVWPRFAAKVALGVLHACMPPEWHVSRAARMLRYAFADGRFHKDLLVAADTVTIVPRQLDEDDREYHWLTPWEHLMILYSGGDQLLVRGVLFGELRFSIAIRSPMQPPTGSQAWLLDTRERRPVALPLDTMVGWLAMRADQFGSASRFHLHRPRGEFSGTVRRATVA